MDEAQLGSSRARPSQTLLPFPLYRRSHLRSQTYRTLLDIFSHCYHHSRLSGSTQLHSTTGELKIPDNGIRRMGQENEEKDSGCSEVFGSDFIYSKASVPQKETQVHETIEGVRAQGRDSSANKLVLDDIELMMGTQEVQDPSRRHMEAMSMQANGIDKEQRLMDELEQIVKGTENLVCHSGSIPLKSGLDEKQNGSSEVGLVDYQVEHVEFQHSDVNKCGNASELQVQGELNQLASEDFHSSLMVNVLASTKGQTSASIISPSSVKHERQHNEMELGKADCDAMDSLPTTKEGEFEKEKKCGQEVAEEILFRLDHDMNNEALTVYEDDRLLDAAILEDKHEMLGEEEKSEISVCANDVMTSSNHLIEKGDIEEGEISGDFEIDGNSFDMSSEDDLLLEQKEVDEVQKTKVVIENIVPPCNIWNGQKKEGSESNCFMVNTLQNANSCRKVEQGTTDKIGIACGVEVAIPQETIKCYKEGGGGSVLNPGNSKDRQSVSKGTTDLTTALAQNQVLHRGFLEEGATKDLENSSAVKKVDVNSKRKRGPVSEEKKAKKKLKKRKKRAEKNRQLGVKRLKLHPIQKPKTITYCRHYLKGRCYEGDKCQFSHDTVPLTKSKPCCHFARHSCMKGDDCPFDHQLSKYPCSNFVSKGSCSRGDACMFSHQVPTKQDIPVPSNVCGPELKPPLLSGNTNLSMPLDNRGCSYFQKNHVSNPMGIHSHVNTEHEVTDTIQKQPTPTPKGISFINVAKSSLLSPSTQQQGMVTQKKESLVQIGNCADQSPSSTAQNLVEIPKKMPAVTPKGINFLSFGKSPVSSFKSPISSFLNRENGIKLPQIDNFGLPEWASASLKKDDCSKVSDGTKQSLLQTALFSNETSGKNQSVAKEMNLNFPGKASTVTSSIMPPLSLFVSRQSSEPLASSYHKYGSNSEHRALSSTLAFAAEHELDIKMKCPGDASPV